MSHLAFRFSPALVLILLVGATHLPFLYQAFHIDDRIYLQVARNTLEKPFFPYDYLPVFEGMGASDAASHSHLPLTSYYLALIMAVTGSSSEWVYHLSFLIFPILAGFSFYDLARRYTSYPLVAACLLLLAPAFLVSSHTLMSDVPVWTFWILTLARFLRIRDGSGSRRDWVVCSLSLVAASFISLLTLGLILLMAAHLFLDRKSSRVSWHWGVLLMLPLLIWFLWYFRAYLHYDRFVLASTAAHMAKRAAFSWDDLAQRGLSFVLNLGGTFVFPLALWWAFAGRISLRIFIWIFLLSFVPFYLWWEQWSWSQVCLFAILFASGLTVFWGYLRQIPQHISGGSRPSQVLLSLWFWGSLVICLLLYYSGSVRYAALALPPTLLLWTASLEGRSRNPYLLRNLLWLAVGVTGLYSLTIAHADYHFANVYRQACRQITQQYAASGRTIWYTGEWGFRYYMEANGARVLYRIGSEPKPGDIIVKPYLATPWGTLFDSDEYLSLLEQRPAQTSTPIRILDFASHAGFYSTGWGILPFSLSAGERWEWFNVFQVKKSYEGPIPEPETHW